MIEPAVIDELVAELSNDIGERNVSREPETRRRASVDGARLSPILASKLPLGFADAVVYAASAEEVATCVAAAVRLGVPVTVRGKGTGNYGQGIPMAGGLVIDVSRARKILEIGDGYITAEAGASLATLESHAWNRGQQLMLYPSTVQSTVGGFLSGGSGGTGSVAHGSISDAGFVLGLDVVHADGESSLTRVEGPDVAPYLHSYGTVGVICRATVRLEPLQQWRVLYASFPDFAESLPVIGELTRLDRTPRLGSLDPPLFAMALPHHAGIPEDRASLRAIVDARSLDAASAAVVAAGGRVELVEEGPQAVLRASMLSYNHPVEWLQKAQPVPYFHMEVSGDALIDRVSEVEAVYPGGSLHVEAFRGAPVGMLAAPYQSEDAVIEGMLRLNELGVATHNPHQWRVDSNVERTRSRKLVTDPGWLLNPGKIEQPTLSRRAGADEREQT
ncbi:FAD/FMN-containing dehydrogenase [Microbacterium sp. SLBN-154]|uniref:FAD-binding oxidoreductase n=1 Tax=Microbacterium sp. SLBN-154 TaxID=2768458 RepID=UPI00115467E3|nr:FAD-binding oxidoreductase [Microbacterium sp. SLBN-154]TQK17644.1 FAD/FMN-containing dehydrogenase [Microbacterium sp. SLBN-154]